MKTIFLFRNKAVGLNDSLSSFCQLAVIAQCLCFFAGPPRLDGAQSELEDAVPASFQGNPRQSHIVEQEQIAHGRKLFMRETFDGNGRSCVACHAITTGTLAPVEAQARYQRAVSSPKGVQIDPLFRSIDSDDGVSEKYDRLLTNATIRVHLDLPPEVTLETDPARRSIVVNRGIPSVINAGLAVVLMADGREPSLESQALHAILGHAQAARLPTQAQLEDIAQYERSLFSRPELAGAVPDGSAPLLPAANTPEEIRGRKHFERGGLCALCHSGPLLNTTLDGRHFENIFVSERNVLQNPVQRFLFQNADATMQRIETPDPGLALITGDVADVNSFRIPTLWNIKNTAPYFHDNSAQTLEDVLAHYRLYLPLSAEDSKDIIAFLKLL